MTIEEARKELESNKRIEQNRIHKDIPLIEALETAIEVLEKQIPKKPNGTRCPICKRALRKAKIENGYTGKIKTRNADDYCPKCGQALDWESDEDD